MKDFNPNLKACYCGMPTPGGCTSCRPADPAAAKAAAGKLPNPVRQRKEDNPKDCEAARRSKIPLSVVPTAMMSYAAVQLHNGKGKYGSYNFRGIGIKFSVYYEAILRHALALWNGEEYDEEGIHNLCGLSANIAILADAHAHGFLIDDRPPKVNERALWDSLRPLLQLNNERNADKQPQHYTSADPVFKA